MSSIEDITGVMINHPILLSEIEQFLTVTKLSDSYLGKRSVNNSELVQRLRRGGRIWPETEMKVRVFMTNRLASIANSSTSSSEDSKGKRNLTSGDAA